MNPDAEIILGGVRHLDSLGIELYALTYGMKKHHFRNPQVMDRLTWEVWLRRGVIFNPGAKLGQLQSLPAGERLCVADCDSPQAERFAADEGILTPDSVIVETSRGIHIWLRTILTEQKNRLNYRQTGCDVLFN